MQALESASFAEVDDSALNTGFLSTSTIEESGILDYSDVTFENKLARWEAMTRKQNQQRQVQQKQQEQTQQNATDEGRSKTIPNDQVGMFTTNKTMDKSVAQNNQPNSKSAILLPPISSFALAKHLKQFNQPPNPIVSPNIAANTEFKKQISPNESISFVSQSSNNSPDASRENSLGHIYAPDEKYTWNVNRNSSLYRQQGSMSAKKNDLLTSSQKVPQYKIQDIPQPMMVPMEFPQQEQRMNDRLLYHAEVNESMTGEGKGNVVMDTPSHLLSTPNQTPSSAHYDITSTSHPGSALHSKLFLDDEEEEDMPRTNRSMHDAAGSMSKSPAKTVPRTNNTHKEPDHDDLVSISSRATTPPMNMSPSKQQHFMTLPPPIALPPLSNTQRRSYSGPRKSKYQQQHQQYGDTGSQQSSCDSLSQPSGAEPPEELEDGLLPNPVLDGNDRHYFLPLPHHPTGDTAHNNNDLMSMATTTLSSLTDENSSANRSNRSNNRSRFFFPSSLKRNLFRNSYPARNSESSINATVLEQIPEDDPALNHNNNHHNNNSINSNSINNNNNSNARKTLSLRLSFRNSWQKLIKKPPRYYRPIHHSQHVYDVSAMDEDLLEQPSSMINTQYLSTLSSLLLYEQEKKRKEEAAQQQQQHEEQEEIEQEQQEYQRQHQKEAAEHERRRQRSVKHSSLKKDNDDSSCSSSSSRSTTPDKGGLNDHTSPRTAANYMKLHDMGSLISPTSEIIRPVSMDHRRHSHRRSMSKRHPTLSSDDLPPSVEEAFTPTMPMQHEKHSPTLSVPEVQQPWIHPLGAGRKSTTIYYDDQSSSEEDNEQHSPISSFHPISPLKTHRMTNTITATTHATEEFSPTIPTTKPTLPVKPPKQSSPSKPENVSLDSIQRHNELIFQLQQEQLVQYQYDRLHKSYQRHFQHLLEGLAPLQHNFKTIGDLATHWENVKARIESVSMLSMHSEKKVGKDKKRNAPPKSPKSSSGKTHFSSKEHQQEEEERRKRVEEQQKLKLSEEEMEAMEHANNPLCHSLAIVLLLPHMNLLEIQCNEVEEEESLLTSSSKLLASSSAVWKKPLEILREWMHPATSLPSQRAKLAPLGVSRSAKEQGVTSSMTHTAAAASVGAASSQSSNNTKKKQRNPKSSSASSSSSRRKKKKAAQAQLETQLTQQLTLLQQEQRKKKKLLRLSVTAFRRYYEDDVTSNYENTQYVGEFDIEGYRPAIAPETMAKKLVALSQLSKSMGGSASYSHSGSIDNENEEEDALNEDKRHHLQPTMSSSWDANQNTFPAHDKEKGLLRTDEESIRLATAMATAAWAEEDASEYVPHIYHQYNKYTGLLVIYIAQMKMDTTWWQSYAKRDPEAYQVRKGLSVLPTFAKTNMSYVEEQRESPGTGETSRSSSQKNGHGLSWKYNPVAEGEDVERKKTRTKHQKKSKHHSSSQKGQYPEDVVDVYAAKKKAVEDDMKVPPSEEGLYNTSSRSNSRSNSRAKSRPSSHRSRHKHSKTASATAISPSSPTLSDAGEYDAIRNYPQPSPPPLDPIRHNHSSRSTSRKGSKHVLSPSSPTSPITTITAINRIPA